MVRSGLPFARRALCPTRQQSTRQQQHTRLRRRRALRLGLLTPSEVLRGLPDDLALLSVADVLCTVPRERRQPLGERLRESGIALSRPLDSLSSGERTELAALLGC